MAETLASLRIAVQTGDLKKATSELDKLEKKGRKAEKATDSLVSSTLKLATAYIGLSTAINLGKDFVSLADEATRVNTKLKLATKSTEELATAQEELFKISQKTRTGFSESVDLFERLTRSTRDYNVEQSEILKTTETINKAMIISGGTAESMNASIIQLGQAFSADFQSVGQELASIREQTPRLYQAFLEGTGKTSKEFKKMAEEGKLSTKIILEALENQGIAVNKEFTKINITVDQSMTLARNSMLSLVDQVNKEFGATSSMATTIKNFSLFLDENSRDIISYGKVVLDGATITANGLESILLVSEKGYLGIALAFEKEIESVLNFILENVDKTISYLADTFNEANDFYGIGFEKLEVNPFEKVDLDSKSIQKEIESIDKSILELGKNTDEAFARLSKGMKGYLELAKQSKTATTETKKATSKFMKSLSEDFSSNLESAIESSLSKVRDFSDFADALGSAVETSLSQAVASSVSDELGGGIGGALGGGIAGAGAGIAISALMSGFMKTSDLEERINNTISMIDDDFNKFQDGLSEASNALKMFGNVALDLNNSVSAIESKIADTGKTLEKLQYLEKAREDNLKGVDYNQFKEVMFEMEKLGFSGTGQVSAGIDTYNQKIEDLEKQRLDLLKGTLADTLDFSRFTTKELNDIIPSIYNLSDFESAVDQLNLLALKQKQGTATDSDIDKIKELTAIGGVWQIGKDYADAIDIVSKSMEDAEKSAEKLAKQQQDITNRINSEMLGQLSYLSEMDKLAYANNLYRGAITQEDRISSARSIAELSRSTTRTREDYIPIFGQYIQELQKQKEDATLNDVVNKLDEVVERLDAIDESNTNNAVYAATA